MYNTITIVTIVITVEFVIVKTNKPIVSEFVSIQYGKLLSLVYWSFDMKSLKNS